MLTVNYQEYNNLIQSVKSQINEDVYQLFEPKETKQIINGEEVIDKVLEINTYDDRFSYELKQQFNKQELREIIMVLQRLARQLHDE